MAKVDWRLWYPALAGMTPEDKEELIEWVQQMMMSKERDHPDWAAPKRTMEQYHTENMERANRFEQHLAQLIEAWKEYRGTQYGLLKLRREFAAAEKSLKELGAMEE